jgi:Ca-activated chloride channel homolog
VPLVFLPALALAADVQIEIRIMRIVLSVSLLFLSQQWQVRPREPTATLSVNVDLVSMLATVADRQGRLISNLKKEDFRLFEDDTPQEISRFSTETDLPLSVVLALDTSASVRDELAFEKEAAVKFLYSTLRRDIDPALLMSFDTDISVVQDYTADPAAVSNAARTMLAGGGTKLYDAVRVASEKLADREGRRFIILISDGEDNCSQASLRQTLELTQRNNVTVYAISTNWVDPSRRKQETEGDRHLKQLATETGGRVFFPKGVRDLNQPFQEIGRELRSQYSIAYRPTNTRQDGGFRRIRIEVSAKHWLVRARDGYFAPERAE